MTPFCHSTVSIPNPNSLMSLSSTLRFSSSLLRRSFGHPRHYRFSLTDPLCSEPTAVWFSRPPQSANNGGLVVSGDSNNGDDSRTESYMAYALSVLLGRALPDVRDGLKPVHRRILLSVGLIASWNFSFIHPKISLVKISFLCHPKNPYKKSARVVGEVQWIFLPNVVSFKFPKIFV